MGLPSLWVIFKEKGENMTEDVKTDNNAKQGTGSFRMLARNMRVMEEKDEKIASLEKQLANYQKGTEQSSKRIHEQAEKLSWSRKRINELEAFHEPILVKKEAEIKILEKSLEGMTRLYAKEHEENRMLAAENKAISNDGLCPITKKHWEDCPIVGTLADLIGEIKQKPIPPFDFRYDWEKVVKFKKEIIDMIQKAGGEIPETACGDAVGASRCLPPSGTQKSAKWSLGFCKICNQMTNQSEGKCLKCERKKLM